MVASRLPGRIGRLAAPAFLVCLVAVLVLTLMPVSIPDEFPSEDKVHHLLAFGALAILACSAWGPPWWVVVPALSGLGAAIELIQHFIPNRSMELNDWVADTAGVLIGWFIYPLLLHGCQWLLARRNS